jgi:hypothetical protein
MLIEYIIFSRHAALDVQSAAVGEGRRIQVTTWVTWETPWTMERALRLRNLHQKATEPSPAANLGHDQEVRAI